MVGQYCPIWAKSLDGIEILLVKGQKFLFLQFFKILSNAIENSNHLLVDGTIRLKNSQASWHISKHNVYHYKKILNSNKL